MKLGELQYNVIFSRFLNPNDNEDSAYLVGQPPPPEGSTYFGVFFEVQNESEEPADAADVAHDHRRRRPDLRRDPQRKPLRASRSAAKSKPQEQIPVLDSTPQQGPIEGSLVALPAARLGLRQPAADALDPGARRPGRSHARPLGCSTAQRPAERTCGRGRGGDFAARRFGFDQQHADRQLRPCRRGRRRRTRRP